MFKGIGVAMLLHLLIPGSIFLITSWVDSKHGILGIWIMINLFFTFSIGLTQWIYLLPVYFFFSKRGQATVAKGIVIGGSLTILFNGLCWGYFMMARR